MPVHKKTFKKVKSTAKRATRSVSRFGKRSSAQAGRFVARRARRVGTAAKVRGRRAVKSVGGRVSLGAKKATRSFTQGAKRTFGKTVGRITTKKGPGLKKVFRGFQRINPIRGISKTAAALKAARPQAGSRNRRRFRR